LICLTLRSGQNAKKPAPAPAAAKKAPAKRAKAAA
jgi:hypothetical protein